MVSAYKTTALPGRNMNLGKDYFIMGSKDVYSLLILCLSDEEYLSSKAGHSTNVLEKRAQSKGNRDFLSIK